MEGGISARQALDRLLLGDKLMREQRQVGLVDARGRVATFTGSRCEPWAGGGTGGGVACQGDLLVGGQVGGGGGGGGRRGGTRAETSATPTSGWTITRRPPRSSPGSSPRSTARSSSAMIPCCPQRPSWWPRSRRGSQSPRYTAGRTP